jgi:hypothetical protein
MWQVVVNKFKSAMFRDFDIIDSAGNDEYEFNVGPIQDAILTSKMFYVAVYTGTYKVIHVENIQIGNNVVIIKHKFKSGKIVETRSITDNVVTIKYEYDNNVKEKEREQLPQEEQFIQSPDIISPLMIYDFKGSDILSEVVADLIKYDREEAQHEDEIILSQTLLFADKTIGHTNRNGGFKLNPRIRLNFIAQGEDASKLVQTVQPERRDEKSIMRKDEILRRIANKLDIPTNTFGLDGGNLTATEILSKDSFFSERINEMMYMIQESFANLVKDYYLFNEQVIISEVEIEEFVKMDALAKAEVIAKNAQWLPVYETMKMVLDTENEDDLMRATCIYKSEKSIPMTFEEYQYALSNNLLPYEMMGE